MATGGSVVYSTSVDVVKIPGRVSSAGAKVAPANAAKFTVTSGSTGVYSITFTEQYAEYLGCQVTLEAASGVYRVDSFTASTRILVINTYAVDGTTATAKAFSFEANFSENKAP